MIFPVLKLIFRINSLAIKPLKNISSARAILNIAVIKSIATEEPVRPICLRFPVIVGGFRIVSLKLSSKKTKPDPNRIINKEHKKASSGAFDLSSI